MFFPKQFSLFEPQRRHLEYMMVKFLYPTSLDSRPRILELFGLKRIESGQMTYLCHTTTSSGALECSMGREIRTSGSVQMFANDNNNFVNRSLVPQ